MDAVKKMQSFSAFMDGYSSGREKEKSSRREAAFQAGVTAFNNQRPATRAWDEYSKDLDVQLAAGTAGPGVEVLEQAQAASALASIAEGDHEAPEGGADLENFGDQPDAEYDETGAAEALAELGDSRRALDAGFQHEQVESVERGEVLELVGDGEDFDGGEAADDYWRGHSAVGEAGGGDTGSELPENSRDDAF